MKVDESCAVDVLLRGTTRTSVQPRSNQVPARTRRERQGQSCDHLDMPPSKPPRYPWPDMAVERSIKRANRSRGRRLGPLSAPRALYILYTVELSTVSRVRQFGREPLKIGINIANQVANVEL